MRNYEVSSQSVNAVLGYLDKKQERKSKNEGDQWGFDTDRQGNSSMNPGKDYNATFEHILEPFLSFTDAIAYRKHTGKPAHVLDLFGSGKFFVETAKPDSVLGIRSKDIFSEEEKLIRPDWWKVLEDNIYTSYYGRNNSELSRSLDLHLQQLGIEGFDFITCRPIGPFDHRFFPEEKSKSGELMDIYYHLLNFFYSYLTPDNGELYTSIPAIGADYELVKNFERQSRFQKHRLVTAEASGLLKSYDDMVLKVTRTPFSPTNFEPFPCVTYID